jgi:hypothetical protein
MPRRPRPAIRCRKRHAPSPASATARQRRSTVVAVDTVVAYPPASPTPLRRRFATPPPPPLRGVEDNPPPAPPPILQPHAVGGGGAERSEAEGGTPPGQSGAVDARHDGRSQADNHPRTHRKPSSPRPPPTSRRPFVIPERRPSAAQDDVSGIHASPPIPAIRCTTRLEPPTAAAVPPPAPLHGRRRIHQRRAPLRRRFATPPPPPLRGVEDSPPPALTPILQPHEVGGRCRAQRGGGGDAAAPSRDGGRPARPPWPGLPPCSRASTARGSPARAGRPPLSRPSAAGGCATSAAVAPPFVIPERRPSAAQEAVSGIHASPAVPRDPVQDGPPASRLAGDAPLRQDLPRLTDPSPSPSPRRSRSAPRGAGRRCARRARGGSWRCPWCGPSGDSRSSTRSCGTARPPGSPAPPC